MKITLADLRRLNRRQLLKIELMIWRLQIYRKIVNWLHLREKREKQT